MPRIDPLSLLRCLSVLLGPNGGIKSKDEVIRLANLMTKFSKKLVSKCIYIQILKSTTPDLLSQFMGAGGWNLIHMWLTDGIVAKNWALIQELLELLLLCPVDIERLKSNNCPKLIKGLSKEGSHQGVRNLASRLVEQWLKMVKGEAMPNSSIQAASLPSSINSVNQIVQSNNASISYVTSQNNVSENAAIVQSNETNQNTTVQQAQTSPQKSQSSSITDKPQTTHPNSMYKITIRDGKQVLTQVQTDAANINAISGNKVQSEIVNNSLTSDDEVAVGQSETNNERVSADSNHTAKDNSSVVINNVISSNNTDQTDNVKNKDNKDDKIKISDSIKTTSDKENRDKKNDKKSVSSSDKKSSSHSSSKSSSKHSSSSHRSGSHRSSSKSSSSSKDKSSRDKEKDKQQSSSSSKSSSSKSKSDREKEREKQKKDQAEKDKATLEKLQTPSLSTKIGKIPKKRPEEEKLHSNHSGDSPSRKASTESIKENKDKSETKKVNPIPEKKNVSISIENRKNSQDQGSRPKTVKTFNSKFRSTGLEEEVKPPTRGIKKPSIPDKKPLPPKLPLKRSSPLRDTGSSIESKKTKLMLDTPTTPPGEEKKGGIKLIPAKPKVMHLQESDMFMDALCASTKSKEPRKRKRRPSLTKDGPTESKKNELAAGADGAASSPPSSPISSPTHPSANKDADDKSILALKPTFKFYQDTLETDEEKDDKSKTKSEVADIEKVEKKEDDDEEERSRTPTPDANFDDEKSNASPEDPASVVSEALKKEEGHVKTSGELKSILLLQKRKGVKKSLKWKIDLESIRYFELDETERVNVTKTFTDMKQMEKLNEREAFQMARKLSSEDVMEEKTTWRPLILIDQPPPLVEPGKDSREKEIQYAREKGILQALYFNRNMIPDSPAEPDEDRHPIYVEPKIIPLDDLTDNESYLKDFSNIPWPEPKPQLPSPSTILQSSSFFNTFRPNPHVQPQPQQVAPQPQMMVQPTMMPINNMPQMIPEIPSPMPPPVSNSTVGVGGWRTGDGKIVAVPEPTGPPMQSYQDANQMAPPGMMGPMYNQDGYMMPASEDGNNYNNFQGPPPGAAMYGGPPPPAGPPTGFQGPRGPPHRGRGGPGWFRGGPPRPPWRGGWRGNKQPPGYRNFKNGYNNRVNCPPY